MSSVFNNITINGNFTADSLNLSETKDFSFIRNGSNIIDIKPNNNICLNSSIEIIGDLNVTGNINNASLNSLIILDENDNYLLKPENTGNITLKPSLNSSNFFRIVDNSGVPIFTVDTANERLFISTDDKIGDTLTIINKQEGNTHLNFQVGIGASKRNVYLKGTSTGSLEINCDYKVYIQKPLVISDSTDSTTINNGSIQSNGGIGIKKSLVVGNNINVNGNVNIGNNLNINGGIKYSVTTYSNNTILSDNEHIINLCNNISITLPKSSNNIGRELILCSIDDYNKLINCNDLNDKIDGVDNIILYNNGDHIRLLSNGINWMII
jgi:hypothetical protein